MANKVKWWWLPAICSFFLFSCVNELDETKGITGKREISFRANKISATVTKSADSNTAAIESDSCGRELFLGLIGNDSLFLTMREEENLMPLSGDIFTKAGDENKPSQFQITGFKDNDNTPYTDLVITSEDNWETYSPKLYWPYQYEAIHFFASTPNPGNSLFSATYPNKNTAVFTYTVPESGQDNDAIMQQDIIYAVAPDNSEDDGNDAVALNFRHILSGIQFNIPTTIGDATVADAKIQLGNIITTRQCTVTGSGASWDNPNPSSQPERGTYSQSIINGETTFPNGESFKLIPQPLTGSGAQYTISFKVGEVDHSYSGDLEGLTEEWEGGKRYIYTLTKREEVKVQVTSEIHENFLQNVKILNTGFKKAYIRVAIVGYWYTMKTLDDGDQIEEIASFWDITDNNTGKISYPNGWDDKWVLKDGFYYYQELVDPGASTSSLFDKYELYKKSGPVPGSLLKIHIVSQAIEQSGVTEWNEQQTTN